MIGESEQAGAHTALPGVPDDQLLVIAHRAEDVRVVIVPGHILPETTFILRGNASLLWTTVSIENA